MTNLTNPGFYTVGGTVQAGSGIYIPRQADQELFQICRDRVFAYVLTPRQMGKSSLMVQTSRQLQSEGIRTANIDLQELGAHATAEEWYVGFLVKLEDQLELETNAWVWWQTQEHLPVPQRLTLFLEQVLLTEITGPVVIFVDEIDTTIGLDFTDDFFAAIRYLYVARAQVPAFHRLSFVLSGVATPGELIRGSQRTPFNIGQQVKLEGFQLHEAQPLASGLTEKVGNPQAVLEAILDWTNGQPFLTQKICQLVLAANSVPTDNETEWVEQLIRSHIIENWEFQDEPEHLRTIRDRLLQHEDQHITRLLDLYQQILEASFSTSTSQVLSTGIPADRSAEQLKILLTGLVIEQAGQLKVFNRIYASIFDHGWIQRNLNALCPYAESLRIWTASGFQDKSRLLRGEALREAQDWAANKDLGSQHYRFLEASKDEELETERERDQILLEAEREKSQLLTKANQLLTKAKQDAKRISVIAVLGAIAASLLAAYQLHRARVAQLRADLIDQATSAMRQFEDGQDIEALKQAMIAGQILQKEFPAGKTSDYPTTLPLSTLQTILDNTYGYNQFNPHPASLGIIPVLLNWQQQQLISSENNAGSNSFVSHIQVRSFSGQVPEDWKTRLPIVQAVSPDGKYAITQQSSNSNASSDGLLQIESALGQTKTIEPEDSSLVSSCQFSPDGQHVAIAYKKGRVKLYQVSGEKLAEFKAPAGLQYIVFSPNGQMIATVEDENRTVRIWNLSGQELVTFKKPEKGIVSLGFSVDGRQIALAEGYNNSEVQIYELRSQKKIAAIETHQDAIQSISFGPDGEKLATGGSNGTIKLWDIKTKEELEEFRDASNIISTSFSPDGKKLAAIEANGIVRFWDLSQAQKTFKGHLNSTIALFDSDEKKLVTAGNEGTVKLWDLTTTKLVDQFNKLPENASYGVSLDKDGQNFLVGEGNTASLWSFKSKQKLAEFKIKETSAITSAVFSPDHQHIALLDSDLNLSIWDRDSKKKQAQVFSSSFLAAFGAVTFSPDGKQIAVGGVDGKVRFWTIDGVLQQEFEVYRNGIVSAIGFSPDGKQIVTGGYNGEVSLWSISEKSERESFKKQRRFEAGKDESAHRGQVSRVLFSPDGQQIVTTGQDGKVKLWNLAGTQIAESDQGRNSTIIPSFSPSGKQLALGIGEGTVKLWQPLPFDLDRLLAQGCQQLHNYLILNPKDLIELEVCQKDRDLVRQAAPNLELEAKTEAKKGNVKQAITLFQTAQTWGVNLGFVPETEAKHLAEVGKAEQLVAKAISLATWLTDKTYLLALPISNPSLGGVGSQSFQSENSLSASEIEKSQKALELLTEATELDPNNVQAIVMRGVAEDKLDRHEEAIQSYNRALQLDPDNIQILINRAIAYNEMKRYEAALSDANQAITLEPKNAEAFSTRGIVYGTQNLHKEALRDFDRALQLDPNNIGFLLSRASTCYLINNCQKALSNVDQVITLDSKNVTAFFLRGAIYSSQKQYKEALQDFDRALQLDPNNIIALYGRINVYLLEENYEQALEDCNRGLKIDPSNAGILSARGTVYFARAIKVDPNGTVDSAKQDYKRALQDFDQVLKLNQKGIESLNSLMSRGSIYHKIEKKYNEALHDFNQAIDIATTDPSINSSIDITSLLTTRRDLYLDTQKYEEALADQNRILKINPQNEEEIAKRGDIYSKMLRYEDALADFNQTLKIDPNNAEKLVQRGNVYRQMLRYEDALADYNRALNVDSTLLSAIVGHGQISFRLKNYEQALADYNNALAQVPDTKPHLRNKGAVLSNRGQVYLWLRQYDKALADLEPSTKVIPRHNNFYLKSIAYQLDGQTERGKASLDQAIQLAQKDSETDPSLLSTLAVYHLVEGNTEQADQMYRQFISKKPSEYVIRQAIRDLDDVLFFFPNQSQAQSMKQLLQSSLK